MVWLCSVSWGWNSDEIYLCCLYCQMSPSYCFAFILYVFFFVQIQLWKLNLQQWDTCIKIFHIMLLYPHSMCLFLWRRKLNKITLYIYEKIKTDNSFRQSPQQSFIFHSVWRDSFYFAPQGQTTATFLGLSEWGKRLQTGVWYFRLVTRAGLQPTENDLRYGKKTFLYLKMYIKWCREHLRSQSIGSTWRLNMAAALEARHPSLSGGSVMALSFSRHVPGSFDTGNMHASWQCLGCAAETMMYISFSSLTDWRL